MIVKIHLKWTDFNIGKECKVPKNYILFIDILLISLYFFLHAHHPPPLFQKKGRALKYLLQKNHIPPQRMQRAWHNYNHVFHII